MLNPVFNEDDPEKLAIDASALMGRYFILRQAGGICIRNDGKIKGDKLRDLSFSILQATEARITRNRYISCPTCGRTRFKLQEALKEVKEATSHLSGLRIAVMGCIVNGPGEMAGADYGYVGAGNGKVHIYRGTEAVVKNVAQEEAVDVLLKVIEKVEPVQLVILFCNCGISDWLIVELFFRRSAFTTSIFTLSPSMYSRPEERPLRQ